MTVEKQLLLVLVLALLHACSIAEAQRRLSGEVTKDGIGVIVAEMVVSQSDRDIDGSRVVWWGTDGTPPKEVVADLRVTVAGGPVAIPFSAFSDLAEPRAIRVLNATTGFSVEIEGSDAAGAYRATLEFVGKQIARRHVASRVFPDERWEQSTYSFVPDDGR